jgi:transcriptional regulator with XRE-family HTH domain
MERRSADLKELGIRIRERRKLLGFSQEKFAQHTGIDRSYMGAIERGQRNVTFWLLCDLASALSCDLGILTQLLGICFWREGLEAALGPERRGGERGLRGKEGAEEVFQ